MPPLPQSKYRYNMADGRRLENRYDVIFPRRMFRFERMQNDTPITVMVEMQTRSRIPI